MAVNRFFDHLNFAETQEQALVQCLVDESIQVHGLDLYYIPRTLISEDYLFGEDSLSNFNSATLIEMYLQSFDGWDGEGSILSKFGLVVPDSATFIVSRKRFDEELTSQFSEVLEPKTGDLIYYPTTDAVLEIRSVKEESPFYQIGERYVYEIIAQKFSYSHETVDTGISNIDDIEDTFGNNNDTSKIPSDNTDVETEADGSSSDGFDDDGTNDRGSGTIVFDEDDPFREY